MFTGRYLTQNSINEIYQTEIIQYKDRALLLGRPTDFYHVLKQRIGLTLSFLILKMGNNVL